MDLKSKFHETVEKYKNNNCLSFVGEKKLTYNDLREEALRYASFLKEHGFQKGGRVTIISENSPYWVIAFWSIVLNEGICVPLLVDFPTSSLEHLIKHSKSSYVFIDKKNYQKFADSSLDGVCFIDIENLCLLEEESTDYFQKIFKRGKEELLRWKSKFLFTEALKELEGCVSIVYTSGTTGNSKGVMLTPQGIYKVAKEAAKLVDIKDGDKFLSILPLAHTYEFSLGMIAPILHGAEIFYFKGKPSPKLLIKALGKVKPDIMLSVPLIIEKIYKNRVLKTIKKNFLLNLIYKVPFLRKKINKKIGAKLKETFGGNLKAFCIGGASLSLEVEKFLREAKFPYCIGYGLTETSPLIAGTGPKETRLGSCGLPLPGIEVRIARKGKGKEGEILVKGENVMKGYFLAPTLTRETFTSDGWLKTGDLGYLDKDGYLFIKGRSKSVIIGADGKNIYPEEIESVLNDNEFVLESLVYSKGNQLIARIYFDQQYLDDFFSWRNLTESELRSKKEKILEEIKEEVNKVLPAYSRINKILEQVEPFEKTPTQKIKRYLYVGD